MLTFARALAEDLRRNGAEALLTRDGDVFVALETRVALAHQAGADIFISLHADSLSQGGAKGATVYTLSDEASDAATAHLAARDGLMMGEVMYLPDGAAGPGWIVARRFSCTSADRSATTKTSIIDQRPIYSTIS